MIGWIAGWMDSWMDKGWMLFVIFGRKRLKDWMVNMYITV